MPKPTEEERLAAVNAETGAIIRGIVTEVLDDISGAMSTVHHIDNVVPFERPDPK